MTDPLIGERMTNPGRYIKHPPAATSLLRDGNPIDSGSEMIIRNNIAHLAEESRRHLVTDLGCYFSDPTNSANGWADLLDDQVPSGWAPTAMRQVISWDSRTALCYGPFPIIADRTIDAGPSTGAISIRKVRVRVESSCSSGTDVVMAGLTVGEGVSPADAIIEGCFASDVPGTGTQVSTFDLVATVSADSLGRVPMRCRSTGARGAVQRSVIAAYLWVGRSPPQNVTIYSVSAFEVL